MLRAFSQYFSPHVLQRIGLDLLLIVVAVIASAVFQADERGVDLKGLFPTALGFSVMVVTINFAFGLYRPVDEDSPQAAFARLVLSALFCLPVAYGAMSLSTWRGFDSLSTRLVVLVLVLLVLVLRVLINRSQASSLFAPRILVLGTGKEAQEVERILLQPEQGRTGVQGFFPVDDEEEQVVASGKIITSGSLSKAIKRLEIDTIIVTMHELRGKAQPLRELLDCKLAGVKILDLPSFYERVRHLVRLDSLRASWLIFGKGFQQDLFQVFVKRVFDLAISACLLVLASPVMLAAGFLIVFSDHGPVFYWQERVGLGGQVFRLIRFRCGRIDGGDIDVESGWSSKVMTPREDLTAVGRVLHKLRIDRLPQLLNVFLGDMSLVGPRPERPSHVDRLANEIPFYGVRHCVKPGLTGWARVRYQGKDHSTPGSVQKLQYDLYYVKNHTLVLDMLVLLETVHVLLMGKSTR